ncbi:hypothetical protein B566_EDAN017516 [Ephemera danica]|nr:hypothetical protein B566_EDAN017516 [Ephemera danica]
MQFLGAHNCGASVLNARFALTAAHCVQGTPLPFLSVISGSTDLNSHTGARHRVRRYMVHEKYDPELSWVNDIAILEVTPSFVMSSLVQPISLPLQDQFVSSGHAATVIGWGRTSPRGPISLTLKEVQIEIREQWLCQSVYDAVGYLVFTSQICADVPQGHRGSCNGDSGGPLFVDGTVVGLVSWALGCATPGYPTVYTRVSFYRDWIERHTSYNSYRLEVS